MYIRPRHARIITAGLALWQVPQAHSAPICATNPRTALSAPITTTGTLVTRAGQTIAFTTDAGLLRVRGGVEGEAKATATMSYYAYFAKGFGGPSRPLIFIWDGGPGASTRPMLLNSFGAVVINMPGTPAAKASSAPVRANPDTLLDVADLVFVDAPGVGFGHLEGCGTERSFYGIDADAAVFQRFIVQFRRTYRRENSPLYLLGESYGTTRAAVVAGGLEKAGTRVSGVFLISQDLALDAISDGSKANIGTENAAFLALPTYAATAWVHGKVPHVGDLETRQREVERFALDVYGPALLQGSDLTPDRRRAIAEKLAAYTGLTAQTWLDENLSIEETRFRELLEADQGKLVGREDTRIDGPTPKLRGSAVEDDPTGIAMDAIMEKAFDSYVRGTLKLGNAPFNPYFDRPWNMHHVTDPAVWGDPYVNTAPDLVAAMRANPDLHVLMVGGYFDLATSYFSGPYLISHLPVSDAVRQRVQWKAYPAPHSVYKLDGARQDLHDRIARLISK